MKKPDDALLLPSAARLRQAEEDIARAMEEMQARLNADIFGGTPEARVRQLRESLGLAPHTPGFTGLARWLP